MLHHDTVLSEEDFLELPEALQRKVCVLSCACPVLFQRVVFMANSQGSRLR